MASYLSKFRKGAGSVVETPRAVLLDIDGSILAVALQALLSSAEEQGGIERFVAALKFKSEIFQDVFANEAQDLTQNRFQKLCMFMPTVRRRVGGYIEDDKFPDLLKAIRGLFSQTEISGKVEAFQHCFPADREHRWVRDLASEILHGTNPELCPLMNRWVWDEKSNSGVIREIWFADNVDSITIEIADDYDVFLKLREELSTYLTSNGVYSDVLHYVDLLCAQIYASYIASQGGSFLKADFAANQDPFTFTRRLLGLDGIKAKSDRILPPDLIDGDAKNIDPILQLNGNS
ncbi:hypothetical protein MNBD_ALPHA04-1176 [hydrothermal vent metagenome]|uniref:Uncharacterized protein n=1 Tax=hydrothermal vent metagenome TaxID=652676 RepID=A0A3B0RL04_9ZZZZ